MLFLVTPIIQGTEDEIDYVVVVEANTPQQALSYCLKHELVFDTQEIKVTEATVHKASLHKVRGNNE